MFSLAYGADLHVGCGPLMPQTRRANLGSREDNVDDADARSRHLTAMVNNELRNGFRTVNFPPLTHGNIGRAAM
jgi:hypothetical protein